MNTTLLDQQLSRLPGGTDLLHALQHCGWQPGHGTEWQGEFYFHTFQGGQVAPFARWQGHKSELMLIVLEDLQLPEPESLFARYLNFSIETRLALVAARMTGAPEWLLLRTNGRLELFHSVSEHCEYRITQADEFEGELLPALAGLARGQREGPGIAASTGAEPLRDWLRHWSLQLGAALELSRDEAERLLWCWILMLQTARRVEITEAARDEWGLRAGREQGRLALAYDSLNSIDGLCHLLESFSLQYSTSIFPPISGFRERLRGLEETTLLERLRAELLMLAQGSFAPETIAWLFTNLSREQEGWRRELSGIEPIRKRIQHEGWHVFQPLACDVGRHGISAALRDAERLAHHLNVLDQFQRQWSRPAGDATFAQPDLFRETPRGISVNGSLTDPLNYLFAEALRLSGLPEAERFGVGITFLLHALALAQRLDWPFFGIDTLDLCFSDTNR